MDPSEETTSHPSTPPDDPDFASTSEFKRFLDGEQPSTMGTDRQPDGPAGRRGPLDRLRASWRRRRTGR